MEKKEEFWEDDLVGEKGESDRGNDEQKTLMMRKERFCENDLLGREKRKR